MDKLVFSKNLMYVFIIFIINNVLIRIDSSLHILGCTAAYKKIETNWFKTS